MKYFKYIPVIIILVFATGCKKYLAEEPTKQASIKTAEQLDALMNNNNNFNNNVNYPGLNFSTDDMEISPALYSASIGLWSTDNLLHFTFDVQQLQDRPSDVFWNGEYKKIFTANIILQNVDKVEGSATLKKQLKADAHFARAFSYWMMVNYYCLPYSIANENAPGLPIKRTVDYGESLVRASLKATYEFIESDLQEALATDQDDVDLAKPWRVSKKAVAAFLSRLYLIKGDLVKSLEQSNLALATTKATLVDYKTLLPGTPQTFTNPSDTLNYSELNNWAAVQFLYWKEFFYTRIAYNSSQWNIPTPSLMSLYDQSNDLRFKYHFIPNSNRRFGIVSPAVFRYTFFSDGRYQPIGPTVSEILLNKAEVLARQGDITNAMAAINTLRAKRMSIVVPPVTAATKDEAILKVLEERRREMPFAMRWFDIRRFSVNDYAADDVTVQHTFYNIINGVPDVSTSVTFTLAPGSKRYAVPINNSEIVNSQNQIEQNKY